jgi:hypothetical protein
MDNIIEPTIDYDFSKLYLGPPSTLAGGAYFTKIMHNTNKLLFIQTPKSLTKQGFVKSGKKIYTDLMFDNNDTVFINWIENLESKCQELIYNKSNSWFETKLEKDDIETAFTSPFKIFKSGKYYLLRINVKQNIKIYNENDQIINCDDITSDKTLISILEIQGIKFTSRNFQIEIELKQSMVVSPDPFLDECFIKKPIRKQNIKEVTIEEHVDTNESFDESVSSTNEASKLTAFINESAKDLAENIVKNDTTSPIDLEEVFDKSESNKIESNKIESNKIESNNELLDNIVLDIEELTPEPIIEENQNILKEFDLLSTLENNLETFTLKKPNQVYFEIYQKARDKAKEAKKNAISAYLEMKNIKKTYMLNDIDDSDSDMDDISSKNSDSDIESLEDS